MVSKFGHCLNDLLFRASIGALPVEIAAVVSNHTDLPRLVGSYGIPFHHMPVTRTPRRRPRRGCWSWSTQEDVELVVLARYMQVLSDDLCRQLSGRDHQHPPLLPAELQGRQALPPGARPRGEADRRDRALRHRRPRRGPDHRAGGRARRTTRSRPDQLVAVGRDVECQALARAVKWHERAPRPAQRPPHGRLRLTPLATTRRSTMLSDIEIANAVDAATDHSRSPVETLGIDDEHLVPYGHYKAKVDLGLPRVARRPPAGPAGPGDRAVPDAGRRGQDHHDRRAHRRAARARPPRGGLPARAVDGPGLRHEGRGGRRRLQPGRPDDGHQPALHR